MLLLVSCLIVSSLPVADSEHASFLRGKVKIVDVYGLEGEKITPGDEFTVFVTLRNDGILWKRAFIRVDLVDDLTGLVRKEIGTSTRYELLWPLSENTYPITCRINEADIEWYKSYSVSAVVYRKLGGNLIISDSTTPQGITIKNVSLDTFIENTKVRITNFDVPNEVSGEFQVTVSARNWGDVPSTIWIRVDMVKPPSLGISGIEGIGTIREEIGHSDTTPTLKPGEEDGYTITCTIPKANKNTRFHVQAVLFAFLEGTRIEIDSSTVHSAQRPFWDRVWMGLFNSIGPIISLIIMVVVLVAASTIVARMIWNKEIDKRLKDWCRNKKKKKKKP